MPLGSPPQRTSQPLPRSNGVKPRLEQVAQSLSHLGGTSSAGSEIGPRQHELQAENAGLKERLRAIENVHHLPMLHSRTSLSKTVSCSITGMLAQCL